DDLEDATAVLAAIDQLRKDGAGDVVVSRRQHGLLASISGEVLQAAAPTMEVADSRGAGDSATAALAVAAARGLDPADTLRLAAASGAVNVTRHGLASGSRDTIEQLAAQVSVEPR